MTRLETKVVAGFLWSQLDLAPEETVGDDHYDREEFADKLFKMLGRENDD